MIRQIYRPRIDRRIGVARFKIGIQVDYFALAAFLASLAAIALALAPLLKPESRRGWIAVALAFAVVAVGLGVTGVIRRPADPVLVSFTEPAVGGPRIKPGHDVKVEGTVTGLVDSHSLWIISQPFDGSNYFVVKGSAVALGDGAFQVVDPKVGDKSDLDEGFYYYPVDADKKCASYLAGFPLPRRIGPGWPAKCKKVGSFGVIRFTTK
jgi:hypothetical protein